MRRGVAVLALGAVLAAPAAAGVPFAGANSASAVRTQPLAPGEVLLETGGIAFITSPADRATFRAEIHARGETRAAADAAASAQLVRIVAAARQAGVPEASIDRRRDILDVLQQASIEPPVDTFEGPGESASAFLTIRNLDVARLETVRAALLAAGARLGEPAYSLTDDGPARRRAQAQAFASARADAEDYAAALDMRVLRIVRITERVGMDMINLLTSRAGELPLTPGRTGTQQTDPNIPAIAMVGVDFALAPR